MSTELVNPRSIFKLMLMAPMMIGAVGCGGNSVEGIWVFSMDENEEVESQSSCEENFIGAKCTSQADSSNSEWTELISRNSAQELMVVEVFGGPGGGVYMVMSDALIPGSSSSMGVWDFTFDDYREIDGQQEHDTGYSYTWSTFSSDAITISLEVGLNGEGTGTIDYTGEYFYQYEESDSWDIEVGLGTVGQIPSSVYLQESGDEGNDYNHYEEDDCNGSRCTLDVAAIYVEQQTFEAYKTELKEGDDFTAIENDSNY